MRFPTSSRALWLLPPCLASGLLACTFNVASHAFELTETSFGPPFDTLYFDMTDSEAALDPGDIVVVGSARSDVEARAQLEALRSLGEPPEVLGAGWGIVVWPARRERA